MKPRVSSPMAEFTRLLADNKPMLRPGRPRALTPELMAAGLKLLAQGVAVRAMCERIGVDQRSWYRVVRPSRPPAPRVRRNKQSLPRAMVLRLRALRRQGLTLRAIAERLGLHVNTLHKYCRQLGLIERRPCGCALRGRPNPKCPQHPPGRSSRETTPTP